MEHKVTKKAMASLKVAHSQLKIDHDDIQVVLKKREKELMKCYSGKSVHFGMADWGKKWVRLVPNGKKKSGTFSDQFSEHFGAVPDLKKSQIYPIWVEYCPILRPNLRVVGAQKGKWCSSR